MTAGEPTNNLDMSNPAVWIGNETGGESISASSDRCLKLALRGEQLCTNMQNEQGIVHLQAALAEGTDDLSTLSAIYSQMGNAYFALANYTKALEYHRHDFTLAKSIDDEHGQAKASGNLGNTLKRLGRFDEAKVCCEQYLKLARKLDDKVGQSRALYCIANVFHDKGKHLAILHRTLDTDPDNEPAGPTKMYPEEVEYALQQAVVYYRLSIGLVEELGDQAALGRCWGNLGNTLYLLGDFDAAVQLHTKRLSVAEQFGDRPAQRRALCNLANSHVFLHEYALAVKFYRMALDMAIELRDGLCEAQLCFSLGVNYTRLGDNQQAVHWHTQHLQLSRKAHDRVGETRACYALAQTYAMLQCAARAAYFALLYYTRAMETGDQSECGTALECLERVQNACVEDDEPLQVDASGDIHPAPVFVPDGCDWLATDHIRTLAMSPQPCHSPTTHTRTMLQDSDTSPAKSKERSEPEDFFDMVTRMSKQYEDQRCEEPSLPALGPACNGALPPAPASAKGNKKRWTRRHSLSLPKFGSMRGKKASSVTGSDGTSRASFQTIDEHQTQESTVENAKGKSLHRRVSGWLRPSHNTSAANTSRQSIGSETNAHAHVDVPSSHKLHSVSNNTHQTKEDRLRQQAEEKELLHLIGNVQSRRLDEQRVCVGDVPATTTNTTAAQHPDPDTGTVLSDNTHPAQHTRGRVENENRAPLATEDLDEWDNRSDTVQHDYDTSIHSLRTLQTVTYS